MSKSSSYKQGPSLVARQSKGYSGDRSHTASGYPHPPCPSSGQSYSAPQSWSSSAGGAPHTSPGFSKFSPAEWANSNVYHYNTADQVSGRLLPNVVNVHRCHTIGDLSSRPCPRSLGSSRSGSGARRCG